MRLANKTMIGINKIHISRGNLFASISGMLAGYLWSEMEDVLLNVKRNYESETKKAIITQVLQNQ